MAPAPHQRVPITVTFVGRAGPPLHSVTRGFGERRIGVALGPGEEAPPAGTPVQFSARLRGETVEGHGQVGGCHAGAGSDDVVVLQLEVTSFAAGAEAVMRRVGFRRRLEGWVSRHPEAAGGLPEVLRRAPHVPDTCPAGLPDVGGEHPAASPGTAGRADAPPSDGAAAARRGSGARLRARRHHWELDSRYRPRD